MLRVTTTDILRQPSLLTPLEGITLIEDGRNHQPKSVLLPYSLYETIKTKMEDELYLSLNKKALGIDAYYEFLNREKITEDIV
jgi:hypothetical protein